MRERVQLRIDIDTGLHRKLKALSAERDLPLTHLIPQLLREGIVDDGNGWADAGSISPAGGSGPAR